MLRVRVTSLVLVILTTACAAAAPPRSSAAPAQASTDSAFTPASDAAADSVLVDVRAMDSTIDVSARYATADNFTGAPLPGYEANRAFLHRDVAAALGRVQARLRTGGLGLRVLDAYRPVRATRAMMEWAEQTGQRALLDSGYIARRSRHNLGVAVDVTLVDGLTGVPLAMGTPHDDFTAAAHTANAVGDALANRTRLKSFMEAEGFVPYDQEWWHFSFPLERPLRFNLPVR